MKKVLVICLILVALGMNCGGGGGESLQGKIEYTEYESNCEYHQDRPPESAYELYIEWEVTNVSQENLKVSSVIFRFYNQVGEKLRFYDFLDEEMKDKHTIDTRVWGGQGTLAPGEGSGGGFNKYFADEVVQYQVAVTDSKGKEYLLALLACGGTKNGEGKITYSEYYFTCEYVQGGPEVIPPETPYELQIDATVENMSQENVEISSVVFRFYNQAGEMIGDHTIYELYNGNTIAPGWGHGTGFNKYLPEEVVRYDVTVTDSEGKEYAWP